MSLTIVKSTDPIEVPRPRVLIYSQPGLFKTTLGYTCDRPLNLDFDHGVRRVENRKDSIQIEAWAHVAEVMETADTILKDYDTLILDTVGRCLDFMILDIIDRNPKRAYEGNLDQQGYGILKARFRTWMAQFDALGKQVVMLAHDKESKKGEDVIVRPDITGGSYGEIMKLADLVGYGYMAGRDRILDFNPSDRWIGKNPCGWPPIKVPHFAKEPRFLGNLLAEARAALGKVSEESAAASHVVEDWRAAIQSYTTQDELNAAVPKIEPLAPVVRAQVARLLSDRGKELGLRYDKPSKQYVAAAAQVPDTFVLA